MLRAMLVDDEPMALEGLRLLIDWRAEGFAVCAECANAGEALDQLAGARPDLIVTDIRMPGMDGLALMEAARARGFDGQFIVASGYGDFEYAQRALRIGVVGYLLKPIEPQSAAEVLERVRHLLIGREADDTQRRAAYQRSLTSLLLGLGAPPGSLPEDAHWRLATWGAPLPYECVREVLAAFPDGAASAHIVEDREFLALRWPAGDAEPKWDAAEALLGLHNRTPIKGRPADLAALPASRRALSAALDADLASLQTRVAALGRAVAHRQTEEFRARCAELAIFCAACGADAKTRAKRQLLAECTRQLADRPAELARLLHAQDADMEALGLLAIGLLAPVQQRVSDRVIGYAQSRLSQRLTLAGVARALGYNATYLGRVFREEQGLSFREWLSDRRVEAAAVLLAQSDAPVYGVAHQVGYLQYKHFLEHFKRRYGQTPEQHRRGAAGR